MEEEVELYPFEFFLVGTPVSLQGRNQARERWKQEVEAAARQRRQEVLEWAFLIEQPLAATIFYFPTAEMDGDIDNIIKPILDALNGVAYVDDNSIERVVAQKLEPQGGWDFTSPSEQLAAALDIVTSENPDPVVYVRIDNDLSWRRL